MSIEDVAKDRKWYVIHTYSGYENKVKANLERKVHSMAMENEIFQIIVPVENEIENKNGKEKVVSHKVFPGYVLVEMIVTDRSWYVVRNTPGVTGFVGSGTKPIPLTDKEIESVLKTIEPQGSSSKKSIPEDFTIKIGDKVTIKSGPCEGFVAAVTDIDYNKSKVKAMVDMFGRETTVEVGFDQIEEI